MNTFFYYIINFSLNMGSFHLVKTTTIMKSLLRPQLCPGDFPISPSFFSALPSSAQSNWAFLATIHTHGSCQTGPQQRQHSDTHLADLGPLLETLFGGLS